MKPLSEQANKDSNIKSDLDFELPVEPGFVSKTHPMTPDEMLQHNQWLIEQLNTSPEAKERWRRDKCDVEFIL